MILPQVPTYIQSKLTIPHLRLVKMLLQREKIGVASLNISLLSPSDISLSMWAHWAQSYSMRLDMS